MIISTKCHKLIFCITIFTRLMLLYRLRNFRHYSSLEELFCELCLRKTNCFFASVILQHVCISQPNDSTIMLGHTQSHQHQCPLKQGHSDGMWWTRREIASDTKIYFLSIQRLYVNKNTLNVRFHWALQRLCVLFLLCSVSQMQLL